MNEDKGRSRIIFKKKIKMNEENKTILIKRVKSFAWRFGMLFVVGAVDFAAENLGLFKLSNEVVVVLGLILGELSKHISNLSKKGV